MKLHLATCHSPLAMQPWGGGVRDPCFRIYSLPETSTLSPTNTLLPQPYTLCSMNHREHPVIWKHYTFYHLWIHKIFFPTTEMIFTVLTSISLSRTFKCHPLRKPSVASWWAGRVRCSMLVLSMFCWNNWFIQLSLPLFGAPQGKQILKVMKLWNSQCLKHGRY